MALAYIDGFEHGLTGTTNAGPYGATAGTPGIVTSPVRTGSRALEISASGAIEYVAFNPAAGTRVVTTSVYIRFASLPSANVTLVAFINANGNSQLRFNNSTTKFQVYTATGAGGVDIGSTITTDTWYLVDLNLDTSTGTISLKGRVDGDAATEATRSASQTAADITGVRLGTGSAETFTAYYDDWVVAVAASGATDPAYPIGIHSVHRLIPTADGTHSISGANEIEVSASGTDITNSTTNAYTLIDDVPLSSTLTDYVNDVGTNTASYVEVTFDNLPSSTDVPIDVYALQYDRDSVITGTNAAVSRVLLSDSTAVTPDLRLSTDDPGATVTLRKKMLDRPSGGWDRTKVDGLKYRAGFGDGSPDAYFESVMLQAAVLALKAEPPLIDQSGVVYAPSVTLKVSPPLIDQTGVTYTPTVTESASGLTVTAPFIDQTGVVYTPTLHVTRVYAPLIDQSGVVYAPAVKRTVTPPLIDQSAVVYAPAVHTSRVYVPLVDQSGVVYAPAVHTTRVYVPLVDQTGVVYAPAVHTTRVYVPFIDQTGVVYTPTVSEGLSAAPPLLDYTAVVYAPAVHTTKVTVPLIDQSAVVYAPDVFVQSTAIRSYSRGGTPTNQTSHTVTLPASVNAGDTLVVFFAVDQLSSITWDDSSHGTWTLAKDHTYATSRRMACYYKEASGTEDSGTLTITSSAVQEAAWIALCVRGWPDGLYGPRVYSNTSTGGSDYNTENLIPGVANDPHPYLWMSAVAHGTDAVADAYPPNYIHGLTQNSGGSDGVTVMVSVREASGSSEDPGSGAVSGADLGAVEMTLGIRRLDITPPLLDYTGAVYTPTVSVSALLTTPPLIDQSGVVYAPTVAFVVTAPFVDQSAVLYVPAVNVDITLAMPLIDVSAVVYEPVVVVSAAPRIEPKYGWDRKRRVYRVSSGTRRRG